MEQSMVDYIRELAEEQVGTSKNGPAFNVLSSSLSEWNNDDVEFLLLDSDTYEVDKEKIWNTYSVVNPEECECYICNRTVKHSVNKLRSKWNITQVLPLLSMEIWNYRVVCSSCYIEKPAISCYHRSLGSMKRNSMAREEAITTLYQAVKVFFMKYSF
jgi:hypothetical protein